MFSRSDPIFSSCSELCIIIYDIMIQIRHCFPSRVIVEVYHHFAPRSGLFSKHKKSLAPYLDKRVAVLNTSLVWGEITSYM